MMETHHPDQEDALEANNTGREVIKTDDVVIIDWKLRTFQYHSECPKLFSCYPKFNISYITHNATHYMHFTVDG